MEIDRIEQIVCDSYGVSVTEIKIRDRKRERVIARQTIFHIAWNNYTYNLKTIGKNYGLDHSTVIHGIQTINDLIDSNKAFKKAYESIMNIIENTFIQLPISEALINLENEYTKIIRHNSNCDPYYTFDKRDYS